jgi:Putative serine esterase (DUF676)
VSIVSLLAGLEFRHQRHPSHPFRILYQRGFFKTVMPINFSTVATPHLGMPQHPQMFSIMFAVFGPGLLSRTGEQFNCVDKWATSGKPLLEVMSDPGKWNLVLSLISNGKLTFLRVISGYFLQGACQVFSHHYIC